MYNKAQIREQKIKVDELWQFWLAAVANAENAGYGEESERMWDIERDARHTHQAAVDELARMKTANKTRVVIGDRDGINQVLDWPGMLAEQTDYDNTIASFEAETGRGL
jgi:hypothetical protein